jgi:LAS superfamily LD-carboxypeptidase LdcB
MYVRFFIYILCAGWVLTFFAFCDVNFFIGNTKNIKPTKTKSEETNIARKKEKSKYPSSTEDIYKKTAPH